MDPGRRRLLRTVVVVAGAVTVLPLVALAAVRLLGLDDRSARLFAAQALTPYAYLPAYAVLAVALLVRARTLAAVAAVLVALHLVWVVPGLRAADTAAGSGVAFEIAATNVTATNTSGADVARVVAALDVDVLVVTELTPALRDHLDAAGIGTRFPHRAEDARAGFFGSAIYSTYPLRNEQRLDLGGLPSLRAEVLVGPAAVTVVAVHTIQPLADHRRLVGQLGTLAEQARASTGPLIMAGDFNATHHHGAFRRLLGTRLRDAHLDRGRGLARTWPATGLPAPPFTLLDHVLVSDEIAVRGVAEFGLPGSDHRGVTARLALR